MADVETQYVNGIASAHISALDNVNEPRLVKRHQKARSFNFDNSREYVAKIKRVCDEHKTPELYEKFILILQHYEANELNWEDVVAHVHFFLSPLKNDLVDGFKVFLSRDVDHVHFEQALQKPVQSQMVIDSLPAMSNIRYRILLHQTICAFGSKVMAHATNKDRPDLVDFYFDCVSQYKNPLGHVALYSLLHEALCFLSRDLVIEFTAWFPKNLRILLRRYWHCRACFDGLLTVLNDVECDDDDPRKTSFLQYCEDLLHTLGDCDHVAREIRSGHYLAEVPRTYTGRAEWDDGQLGYDTDAREPQQRQLCG